MSYLNHLIFSLSCDIFLIKILKLKFNIDLIFLILFSLFFSILPDIDHIKSFIGRNFFFISYFIYRIFGHRKFIHSILFFFLFYFFIFKYNKIFILNTKFIYIKYSFFIGYLSHIIIDMLTIKGVKLFWPININFRLPFFFIFKKKKNRDNFFIFLFFFSILIDYFLCILYILFNNLYNI